MAEGIRRPEGYAPGQGKRAPGRGPHPLLAAFAALGWRPSNGVVRFLVTLPRDATVEQAIREIPPHWFATLSSLGAALRKVSPPPWNLLALLPRYAAHGEDPQPTRHPADAWGGR